MVSDFVNDVSGFVWDGSNMAHLLLETNEDAYFTNDHLLDQVKKTIDIFEDTHPSCRGIFLFDNAPSHKKVADDSLNVDKMNVVNSHQCAIPHGKGGYSKWCIQMGHRKE